MAEQSKPDEADAAVADDLELSEEESEQVKGGRSPLDVVKKPSPGGPVPVPYPNV